MAQFDPVFYKKAYSDLSRYINLRAHYALCGKLENRLPNEQTFKALYPLFDLEVYRQHSPLLIFRSNEAYYAHFHHHGFDENRYFAIVNGNPFNKRHMVPTCHHRHIGDYRCSLHWGGGCDDWCPSGCPTPDGCAFLWTAPAFICHRISPF